MTEALFIQQRPSLEGFPTSLLPPGIVSVLLKEGFRLVSRIDTRRVQLECMGVQVGKGTPERPDLGITYFTLQIEIGVFGTHLIKHVLLPTDIPVSGVVYSGRNFRSGRFLKMLLSHCTHGDAHLTIDEERLAFRIQKELEALFNASLEVSCQWHPIKTEIEVTIHHPACKPFSFVVADSGNPCELAVYNAQIVLSKCL